MSVPKFTNKGATYIFDWELEQLQIEVSNLRSGRDDRLSCVVTATTPHAEYQSHLYQTEFNPLSPGKKAELKKELSQRYKPTGIHILWDEVIENFCVNTVKQFGKGEPVEDIWSTEEWSKPEYLLYPVILKNKPNVIFGDAGTCKTELSLLFGTYALLPEGGNTLGLTCPKEMHKPLVLDYEADKPEIGWRLKALQEGMNFPPIAMAVRRCHCPLAQEVEQIKRFISDFKIELLIIDSLGLACGGELRDAAPALRFFSALRYLNITSLIIAHTAKNSDSQRRTVFGSMYFEALSRSIWEISADQEDGASDVNLVMRHVKANMSRRHPPLGFNVNFADDKTVVTSIDPNSITGLVERMGATNKILQTLKQKPMSNQELADATGLTLSQIYNATARLRSKNLITKNGNQWGVVSRMTEI